MEPIDFVIDPDGAVHLNLLFRACRKESRLEAAPTNGFHPEAGGTGFRPRFFFIDIFLDLTH